MTVQRRFDGKTGGLEDRKVFDSRFETGDKVRLIKKYRIHNGAFTVSDLGIDVSSKLVLYSCYRINEKGHTIWFSCGESVLEEVRR